MLSPTSTPQAPKSTYPGLLVLHAGLFRTASASMAAAYRILGYNSHHGLHDVWTVPWQALGDAALATFHVHKRYPPAKPKYTRAEWDALFAPYSIWTDLASPFVPELLAIYPDAKVVIVQRPFDQWWPSMKEEVLPVTQSASAPFATFLCCQIIGWPAPWAMQRILHGFFNVRTGAEITEKVARERYEEYYRTIREKVPEERRLEYRLEEGWGPLCRFLGKEVPECEFPFLNGREEHQRTVREQQQEMGRRVWRVARPWVFGIGAGLVGVMVWRWMG